MNSTAVVCTLLIVSYYLMKYRCFMLTFVYVPYDFRLFLYVDEAVNFLSCYTNLK